MSFDWKNYFYLAQQLSTNNADHPYDEESKQRAAISRAYYAAYKMARNYLEEYENFSRSNIEGTHIQVIAKFRELQYSNKFNGNIATHLQNMMLRRVSADYEDNFSKKTRQVSLGSVAKEATYTLRLAQQVFRDLTELQRIADSKQR